MFKALESMLKAVSNNHFYFLKSFLTFKFPDSGPLPKPQVICLDNKNCHPGFRLYEIVAAAQPHVLWGKAEQRAWRRYNCLYYIVSQDCKRYLLIWWLLTHLRIKLILSPVPNLIWCYNLWRSRSSHALKCISHLILTTGPFKSRGKQKLREPE